MNVSDKASLFQLSFAFLRRFAVIDAPLPDEPQYRALITSRLGDPVPEAVRAEIIDAAIKITYGPVRIGPAILLDIAEFTVRGLTVTSGRQRSLRRPARSLPHRGPAVCGASVRGQKLRRQRGFREPAARRLAEPPGRRLAGARTQPRDRGSLVNQRLDSALIDTAAFSPREYQAMLEEVRAPIDVSELAQDKPTEE
jgi:hypothetical protein